MARLRNVVSGDRQPTEVESQLHVALNNMPGALVYTDDDLRIVVCNDRFKEMYPAPRELLQPGRPYPDFLRYLAENGYYGEGDVDALVAQRVESLRNPSGQSFEDRAPDGRVYRILRRRAAAGGTVTVMTDITEQKRAEQNLAQKEAQLHVALDNMPGALVYTDENLNIVFCNDRFKEMYRVPDELLQPGRPIRFPALSGRERLLRRGRRRRPGRPARGEPAQPFRQELRRPHAGRPGLSHSPPSGGGWAAPSR